MHASEVKPVGKDEQKRIIQNAPSDSPAKKQKFQTLLEFFEDLEIDFGPGNTQPVGRKWSTVD